MSFVDRLGIHLIQKNPEAIEQNVDRSLGLLANALQWAVNRELRAVTPEHGPQPEVNTHYRPALEILQSGIEQFTQETGKNVEWQRNPNYLGLSQLQEVLNRPLSETRYFDIQGAVVKNLNAKLSIQDFERRYGTSDNPKPKTFGEALTMALADGGRRANIFYSVFQELGPERSRSLNDAEAYPFATTVVKISERRQAQGLPGISTEAFRAQMIELIQLVEEKRVATGEPVSIEFILSELLKKCDGNMNDAISSLNAFLKSVSRNYSPKGMRLEGRELVLYRSNWVKDHILDEFSPVMNFNELPVPTDVTDEKEKIGRPALYAKIMKVLTGKKQPEHFDPRTNLTNRIGTPYHITNLIELLQDCSPELVMVATGQEYVVSGQEHGSVKALADILLLKNLRTIDTYLQSFSKKSS